MQEATTETPASAGSEVAVRVEGLPLLIERAAAALASASTAAEVLDARHYAGAAYTITKETARFAKLKDAHDTIVAACHKAMADALEIETQARQRLANEYDEAQERGEVAQRGGSGSNQHANVPNEDICTLEDIGLTRKEIHEARFVRDAERRDPGIVRRTMDALLAAGEEPSRAALLRALTQPKPVRQPERAPSPAPSWRDPRDAPPDRENMTDEEMFQFLRKKEELLTTDAFHQTPLGQAWARYKEARYWVEHYEPGNIDRLFDAKDEERTAEYLLVEEMLAALGLPELD
jgi:hypothetical protein